MADTIKCQVCGEDNPADLEFCQNCQSRLRPLTGPLRDENVPIQPGDVPTKKVTAELEPILPQWLRDARQQARQSEEEESQKAGQEPDTTPRSQGPDLLAGLASQAEGEDDEETPDWLANITGTPAKKKKPGPEDTQVKWVELGHDDSPQETDQNNEEGNLLPWMKQQEPMPERDELTEWFNQASSDASGQGSAFPSPAAPGSESSAFESPAPSADQGNLDVEWFKNLETNVPAFDQQESEILPPQEEPPDWLKNLQADASNFAAASSAEPPAGEPPAGSETEVQPPDWLKNLDAGTSAAPFLAASEGEAPSAEQTETGDVETPDWLKDLGADASVPQPPRSEPGRPFENEAQQPGQEVSPAGSSDSGGSNVPDWLMAFGEPEAPAAPQESTPGEGTPDWLDAASASGSESLAQSEKADEAAGQEVPGTGELPDWMASLRPVESQPSEPSVQALLPEDQTPTPSASPFEEEALQSGDVDAIFSSMQLPDWLSDSAPADSSVGQENLPPAAQSDESIAPAELPSWVQAMRPVESAMPTAPVPETDTTPESGGPLAGLHGVLPAIPGAVEPSSKPKVHSLKLDATEEQQAHSALLEKILAAETSPVPIKAASQLASQRLLRWAITAMLFAVLGGVVFGGTRIFPMPNGTPNETIRAIQSVESIPEDAPVLAVFDYEPSTVGEMEASGASLLDHLLLLRHPHLALISTSPTGAALAERFMSGTLSARGYQPGQQYVNLGYLPGGLTGVYDFARSPSTTVTLGADSSAVWNSPVLGNVRNLSDFAAVIVLTDSAEAGRTWIEQTQLARGNTMLVMVSSAQAGPMLIPYADSGQLSGLVSGINGAAGTEQVNNGLPGFVRGYWDAYSLGLLLAVVLILLGGFWNFWRGLQDRRTREAV